MHVLISYFTDFKKLSIKWLLNIPSYRRSSTWLLDVLSCLYQIDGEAVTDFIFLGSKITVDGDCSHEVKRHLLLGEKAMTNLDSILKSRDITLPTKVRIFKAMVFPVVTFGCESRAIKKAEHRRTDTFEMWCWRRLLRVPWTARGSNQLIAKGINPEYSLEGLMLKLKLQYFGHLMGRADSLEKALGIGGNKKDKGTCKGMKSLSLHSEKASNAANIGRW